MHILNHMKPKLFQHVIHFPISYFMEAIFNDTVLSFFFSLCSFLLEVIYMYYLVSFTNRYRAASLADSSPASVPLPLRVEPKPKSGIRLIFFHPNLALCMFSGFSVFIVSIFFAIQAARSSEKSC